MLAILLQSYSTKNETCTRVLDIYNKSSTLRCFNTQYNTILNASAIPYTLYLLIFFFYKRACKDTLVAILDTNAYAFLDDPSLYVYLYLVANFLLNFSRYITYEVIYMENASTIYYIKLQVHKSAAVK